jgi:hypothetical protein
MRRMERGMRALRGMGDSSRPMYTILTKKQENQRLFLILGIIGAGREILAPGDRLTMTHFRLAAALPLLAISAGCFKTAEPPPAPPIAAPPAIVSKTPAGMSELPPDPRALKNSSTSTNSTSAGSVGLSPLPAAPVAGSALNKFFPNDQDGYNRVFTQEKKGFAQAFLDKGKTKVAEISINDCAANPSARDKYKTASMQIGGFPAVREGMNSGLAVLVGDRYQVKIRATGGALSENDMEAWLQKFDLNGLSGLK